ncbi:MAG: LysM peptidoglycan-binding domain-containing protein [Candidatus Omnitrophica bacterium]|nr:LysM peptidoglycan-binding domain-containing protein [Candidatus Omnitrophota bacterium]
MKRRIIIYVLSLGSLALLSGCVVRSYSVTKDRLDQDLSSGNRGYMAGEGPQIDEKSRKSTRDIRVVEIEMRSPVRFEKKAGASFKKEPQEKIRITKSEDREAWGNRGYLTQSETPEISGMEDERYDGTANKYIVQKGDTLQKISKEFYNTTKKWMYLYEVNRDVLKGPNKIYPGQSLKIPKEPLKEPKENLK